MTITTQNIFTNFLASLPVDATNSSLKDSIHTYGVIDPILLYQTDTDCLLLDGKQRLALSPNADIPSLTLTSDQDPVPLFYLRHKQKLTTSPFTRISFLSFLDRHDYLTDEWIATLDFKPYKAFVHYCHKISSLPTPIQAFVSDKQLSFKQLLNIAQQPADHVLAVFGAAQSPTASQLIQLLDITRDLSRRLEVAVSDLVSPMPAVELLAQLRQQASPTLVATQTAIQDALHPIESLGLSVNWDKSLENKRLDVTVSFSDIDSLKQSLRDLDANTPHLEKALHHL